MLDALLAGIVSDPLEETRWLVLADWLEEFDDPRRGELLRLHRKLLATCCETELHPERTTWHARIVELIGGDIRPCVPQETLLLPGDIPMTFSFIPPGRFRMGSAHSETRANERPVHMVTVTKGFFLGIYPVTQVQWQAVMGADPSYFKGPYRPVDTVSWYEAQEFCTKLTTILQGRRAVHLPTEAEWEYACRAGATTEYHFGDAITTDLVNYDGNNTWNGSPKGQYREQTTDVGKFPANPWGLFDIHGNVWAWCEDWYGPYSAEDQVDPCRTTPHSNEYRVLRGGSWDDNPVNCRAAFRAGLSLAGRDYYYGFRVCFRLD